jgi:hypothetical protein
LNQVFIHFLATGIKLNVLIMQKSTKRLQKEHCSWSIAADFCHLSYISIIEEGTFPLGILSF